MILNRGNPGKPESEVLGKGIFLDFWIISFLYNQISIEESNDFIPTENICATKSSNLKNLPENKLLSYTEIIRKEGEFLKIEIVTDVINTSISDSYLIFPLSLLVVLLR